MNYSEFVRSRFKSGKKIAAEMTAHKAALLNMLCRQVVDSANSLDHVKKYAIYNKQNLASQTPVSLNEQRLCENFKPTPSQCELLHAAIGIAGESGELLDAVRKLFFEGQPLDRENVIEELGDLCFYLEAACQAIGVTREEIEEINTAKLSKRYEGSYSDRAAQDRADKAGAE